MTTKNLRYLVIFMSLCSLYLYRWQRIRVKCSIRLKLSFRSLMEYVFRALWLLVKQRYVALNGMCCVGVRGDWLQLEKDYDIDFQFIKLFGLTYTHEPARSHFKLWTKQLVIKL